MYIDNNEAIAIGYDFKDEYELMDEIYYKFDELESLELGDEAESIIMKIKQLISCIE